MMQDSIEAIVQRIKSHKITPEEQRAQRVSLIIGLADKASTITRDQVSSFLDNVEGRPSKEGGKNMA
jgi:hypothetical protein